MIGDHDPDDRTRAAIRAVADVPAPPVTTTLDAVIQRGRRRTLVQRGATVAAVVGVVAAIGVGGVLLRSATEGQGVRPAGPAPTTTPTTTRAEPPSTHLLPIPPSVSSSTSIAPPQGGLLPGWSWVDAPITQNGDRYCKGGNDIDQPPELPLPGQAEVRTAFVGSVREQTGTEPHLVSQSWEPHSPKTGTPRGYLEVNVDMGDGPGSVQLEVDSFAGTPTSAADLDAAVYGNCDPPARTTLDSGAVLQLYQAEHSDPKLPMQHLGVYLPNGRHYIVTTAGYGESDKVPVADSGYTIESGRGRLPLDDGRLAAVGEALAALRK
jgi:hypothetical protein